MASIQKKGASFYCQFLYQGRRRTVTIGKVSQTSAEAFAVRAEELLGLLARGRLSLPAGMDITDFVLRDGKPPDATAPLAAPITFLEFKQKYLEIYGNGAMETNSLSTVTTHLGHFGRTLGDEFPLQQLALPDLQRHIAARSKKKYRGKPLSPVTLKKETASFRAAWNWAALTGLVSGVFPSKGLVYPKSDEKPPFATWQEIERRVQTGGLPVEQIEELWNSLYLRKEEIEQLLVHIRERATQPWVYPLCCTAAHTGARRSELLRAEVADIDFDAGTVLIREKKRSRQQRTTRHVSLTPFLAQVLRDWLAAHPGGPHLFCQQAEVAHSKKRSRTTGHQSDKMRPTSGKARAATVRERGRTSFGPITKDEAHDHFRRTLAGSKWGVLRGYHVLRHSFISCMAAAGVDQRIIDEFVGHQTEEQRRRYRHLIPDVKQKAITSVFGETAGEVAREGGQRM